MTTQDEINKAEYDSPANWHGPLYASKKNSRIVVPKKRGLRGVTVNFAKPAGIMIHVINIVVLTIAVVWGYSAFIH